MSWPLTRRCKADGGSTSQLMGVGPAERLGPHPYPLVCRHCVILGRACHCEQVVICLQRSHSVPWNMSFSVLVFVEVTRG